MQVISLIKKQKEERHMRSYISVLCNVTGILTFLFLMIYFLLMAAIGLRELYTLRDLNFIILAAGILLGLFLYKRKYHHIDYLTGIKIGLRITFTAVLPFSALIYSYLATDISFINYFKERLSAGEFFSISGDFITPFTLALIICLEGSLSGCIISALAMEYFKIKTNLKITGHE